MLFVFDSFLYRSKTQKMCYRIVSEDPFLIVYCPDKHKTQRMCGEAVVILLQHLNLFQDVLQVK